MQNTDLRRADLRGDQDKVIIRGAKYTDANTTPEVCRRYFVNRYSCATVLPEGLDTKKEGIVLLKK